MSEENIEIVNEARSQGWVPQEEFKGPEEQWVDAEAFVKRGREINPILRKHNADLKKEIEKVRREAQEAIDTAKEFKEFQKANYERQKQIYENEIANLRQERKQAISSGDGDAVDAIETRIDELKAEKDKLPEPKPQEEKKEQPDGPDTTLQEWLDDNPWFGQDEETTEMANAIAAVIRRKNPSLVGKDFLVEFDKKLEEKNIKQAKKAREPVASAVEGGSTTARVSKSKQTYESLPPDAKAACDRYVKQGLMSKEEYVNSYEW